MSVVPAEPDLPFLEIDLKTPGDSQETESRSKDANESLIENGTKEKDGAIEDAGEGRKGQTEPTISRRSIYRNRYYWLGIGSLLIAMAILPFTVHHSQNTSQPSYHRSTNPSLRNGDSEQSKSNGRRAAETEPPGPPTLIPETSTPKPKPKKLNFTQQLYGDTSGCHCLNLPYADTSIKGWPLDSNVSFFGMPKTYKLPSLENITCTAQYTTYCAQPLRDWGANYTALNMTATRNCTNLNVFYSSEWHKMKSEGVKELPYYPVMVIFHDGDFIGGSVADLGMHGIIRNFVKKNIVVVTVNYRVGVLGFYAFNEENSAAFFRVRSAQGDSKFSTGLPPRNRGIYDQVEALRWVNKHIDKMGGNASEVTVVGIGASACTLSRIVLAWHNEKTGIWKLFKRAIIHGGSTDSCTVIGHVLGDNDGFLKALRKDCTTSGNIDACVLTASPEAIAKAANASSPYWAVDLDDTRGIFGNKMAMIEQAKMHPVSSNHTLDVVYTMAEHEWAYYDRLYFRSAKGMNYTCVLDVKRNTASCREALQLDILRMMLHNTVLKDIQGEEVERLTDELTRLYLPVQPTAADERGWYELYVAIMTDAIFGYDMMSNARLLNKQFSRTTHVHLVKFGHRTNETLMAKAVPNYNAKTMKNTAPHGADTMLLLMPEWGWLGLEPYPRTTVIEAFTAELSIIEQWVAFVRSGQQEGVTGGAAVQRKHSLMEWKEYGAYYHTVFDDGFAFGAEFIRPDVEAFWVKQQQKMMAKGKK